MNPFAPLKKVKELISYRSEMTVQKDGHKLAESEALEPNFLPLDGQSVNFLIVR